MLTTSKIELGDGRSGKVEQSMFREAMSRFASAVHLVTTDGAAGLRGVTATSVCSVSDEPATLLACLNTSSATNQRFAENGCFCVNLLSSRNETLARAFAGEGALEPEARFALGHWTQLVTGAPVLEEALVAFDCRLIDARVVATHHVFFAEVVAIHAGAPGASLLYRDRTFRRLD